MVACSFAKKEMAAAAARWCSLLLSWMMASRPSCRDFSLIRWDLVFLLSKVLTPLYSARPQANRWDLAWRTQTAKFSSPAAQTRRPSARLTSLKAQSRAKLGRSEFVAKWSCAFREQTDSRPSKKTKKKTKETKDAKKKRYGVYYLSL